MNYKSYPNEKITPSRLARKKLRNETFIYNKKAKGIEQKSRRLERKSQQGQTAE